MAKQTVHGLLRRLGVDLVRYGPEHFPALRRVKIMRSRGVDLVLDVGASAGQWARLVRRSGYAGRIVSFEPLTDAFVELDRAAGADPAWEARKIALGDVDGSAEINIAGNSWSSSLLPMTPLHAESAPDSRYVGSEVVTTARLDSLGGEFVRPAERLFLKLDVQGFELAVLRGASATLPQVEAIEVELSHAELYTGQALLPEVVTHLHGAGLDLIAVEPVFSDPRSGELLQVDGIFLRRPTR